jgi:RND family efflux transporter MFP subunit
VTGFLERVEVDRGSVVTEGQLLATLVAPELAAQRKEAEARVQAVRSSRAEAEAKLLSSQSTWERLKAASATPGAIAGNELVVAEKVVEAARAQVKAVESSIEAAEAAVAAVRDMEAYLRVTAPFSGIITERNVHPGALAGAAEAPMFRLEQNSRLRLVVAVPEVDVSGISRGSQVSFTVAAWPGETFTGVVARAAQSMDPKTRSMAVELDVNNARGRLAPGMYPTVQWPVRKARPALLVPAIAVVTTTERTFVIRVSNGVAEWVPVVKGAVLGVLVEIQGALKAGDWVVERASDELRAGTRVAAKQVKSS